MQSSLAYRLGTTPVLISEVEGCTVFEQLIFIPMPEGRTEGSASGAAFPLSGPARAHVSDLHHEDSSK